MSASADGGRYGSAVAVLAFIEDDPRIRSASHLSRRIGAPLLAVIPTYHTPAERRQDVARVALSFAIVATVVVAYGLVYGYKQLYA